MRVALALGGEWERGNGNHYRRGPDLSAIRIHWHCGQSRGTGHGFRLCPCPTRPRRRRVEVDNGQGIMTRRVTVTISGTGAPRERRTLRVALWIIVAVMIAVMPYVSARADIDTSLAWEVATQTWRHDMTARQRMAHCDARRPVERARAIVRRHHSGLTRDARKGLRRAYRHLLRQC